MKGFLFSFLTLLASSSALMRSSWFHSDCSATKSTSRPPHVRIDKTRLQVAGANFELNPSIFKAIGVFAASMLLTMSPNIVMAKPEGVNRPDLLPKEKTTVIDVANFLTKGQEKKIISKIEELEKNAGYKLRLLCQSYPETPGLAIKDYWGVDDNTIVVVIDRGEGFNRKGIPLNIINLNIGRNVEPVLPSQFWTRLTNKLGNQPYVKENGEAIAILNAVESITFCLQDKECTDIPFNL